uniref:Transcription elongation factor 1 homolog n=1 Tax=Hucho hucho TaxID=62062 RepID=A0A4W5Q040_9TELE
MGRRKSKRKPPPKKKLTGNLDTQFTCPFCNHEKSCDVKMERTRNTGIISCTVCLEEFQTPITCILSILCLFFSQMLKGFQNTRWHTNVGGKNATWPSDYYGLSIKQRSL